MSAILTLSNVTKDFGNQKGIFDVNLEIRRGEIFGFLGPNGAGKTTTIRCIMDFIRPQNGVITVAGHNSQTESVAAKQNIGFLPAESQLYEHWTGYDHVRFYQSVKGASSTEANAKRLGLDLSVQVRNLSTGNRQKLALVLALLGKPKLIIMDEPTKGLDPLLQQEIYDILKEYKQRGGTVFVSSHNLPEVEKICDRVGVIKDGHIVANESMEQIRAMSTHLVTIISGQKLNSKDFAHGNVTILHQTDKHLILKVTGDLNKVVGAAAKYPLKDLEVTHANLEDIFMEYYK